MWKYLNESVQGASHKQLGVVCQDASFVTPYRSGDEEILIMACADGAGSAKQADVGARLACRSITDCATEYFESGLTLSDLAEPRLRSWVQEVRAVLVSEGRAADVAVRDLACTLLFAIVGAKKAAFCQIGDGAIVISQADKYRPVFWPQSGEYQNTTYFVTDERSDEQAQLEIAAEANVQEVAMFTDGLQMLALHYASKTAHEPFFRQMFHALREAADGQDLIAPLKQLLDSDAVNKRTDDDKTLVLATRVTGADAGI